MKDRVEQSYRRVHPRLWHALLAYSGDADLAGDAESEAFAQLLRRREAVRDPDAWVWRSAFRIAAGMLDERRRQTPLQAAPDPDPVHRDVSVVEFISQLDALSAQQRAVVVLRYVGRFTPAEIADLLDTSPGTVRVQLHRAHAQLAQRMEATGER